MALEDTEQPNDRTSRTGHTGYFPDIVVDEWERLIEHAELNEH